MQAPTEYSSNASRQTMNESRSDVVSVTNG